MTMTRQFELSPAVRRKVPLMIGLTGASGSGKTYSALRLATGIQRVSGGDIHFIDTEANRALHYAPSRTGANGFKFQHLPFGAPFSPLDYLAAIEHCVKSGAGIVVVDSMSHEHEGPGGVLEMHDKIVQDRSKGDWRKAQAITFACWAEPKAQRRRLINSILQMEVNAIFCFRAKSKVRMPNKAEKESGLREPVQLGWMPIAGEEFVYEVTWSGLLMPGSRGIPTLDPENSGEKQMTKLPDQFRHLLTDGRQLSEDLGQEMAEWAQGDSVDVPSVADIVRRIAAAQSDEELERVVAATKPDVARLSKADKSQVISAWKARKADLERKPVDEPEPLSVAGDREPGSDG
jgi:hypothetical protein